MSDQNKEQTLDELWDEIQAFYRVGKEMTKGNYERFLHLKESVKALDSDGKPPRNNPQERSQALSWLYQQLRMRERFFAANGNKWEEPTPK